MGVQSLYALLVWLVGRRRSIDRLAERSLDAGSGPAKSIREPAPSLPAPSLSSSAIHDKRSDHGCQARLTWPPRELEDLIVTAPAPGVWTPEYEIGDQLSVLLIPIGAAHLTNPDDSAGMEKH